MLKRPAPGLVVGKKYRLTARIGGGGMGEVYKADGPGGGTFAVKVLSPEHANRADVMARFEQESTAVSRVRHPNIVTIHDAGTDDVGPYIAMEYLEGASMGLALARLGVLPAAKVVSAMVPLLDALDAAHRAGIIHRDLKPENVFITKNGDTAMVKLLDFGIAKLIADPTTRTSTGVVFGTPDYLSPEQATGEGHLDGRSDLFSVGILTYELLTGRRPFSAPTAVATAFRVVHAEPRPLAEIGVDVPERLPGVLRRLLEKEPADRYPRAGDAMRDFERIIPDPAERSAQLMELLQELRGDDARSSGERRVTPPEVVRRSEERASQPELPTRDRPSDRGVSAQTPAATAEPTVRLTDPHDSETSGLRLRAEPPDQPSGDGHQVFGPVLRSLDWGVSLVYGHRARDQVVANMPEPYGAELRNDSINALVAYDLEAVVTYLRLATSSLLRDARQWRHLGRLAVGGELHGVVRAVLRPAPLPLVARRTASVLSRLFTFGTWAVEEGREGCVQVRVDNFDPAPPTLRMWLVGVAEEVARRATEQAVRTAIATGMGPRGPFSWELQPAEHSTAVG